MCIRDRCIDDAERQELPSFYLEIRSNPVISTKQTIMDVEENDLDIGAELDGDE